MKKVFALLLSLLAVRIFAKEPEEFVFYMDSFGFRKYTVTSLKIIFEDEDAQISEEHDRKELVLADDGFYYLSGKLVVFSVGGFCFYPQTAGRSQDYMKFISAHKKLIE